MAINGLIFSSVEGNVEGHSQKKHSLLSIFINANDFKINQIGPGISYLENSILKCIRLKFVDISVYFNRSFYPALNLPTAKNYRLSALPLPQPGNSIKLGSKQKSIIGNI